MKRSSLILRVVASLCVAQTLAFFLAWLLTVVLGLLGFEIFTTSVEELSAISAKKQVVASLRLSGRGSVEIWPTPALAAELKRSSGMKVAAFRSYSRLPLEGSSPELVEALKPLIALNPGHVHFILPGDPATVRRGLLEPQRTPFGRIHIAVYGQEFRWGDVVDAAEEDMLWMAAYLIMGFPMSAGAAWFAVLWGLKPLQVIVAQAAKIDMNSLHQRLDSREVSSEIAPLVDAFNEALARVDVGVARQRRFTANAAHELRTPVSILGARLDAPEEPTFRNDLKRDHRRIRNLVEQLLATARLGVPQSQASEDLDLCAIVRGAIADAALLALRARRTIVLEAPQEPVMVQSNRSALESVIATLVDNAIRAEPEGGTVTVRVTPEPQLAVIDNGSGVATGDRRAVFEPFWRKAPAGSGTGLGLAIASELMGALGGRIWVEETRGGGATFKVAFHRPDAEAGGGS